MISFTRDELFTSFRDLSLVDATILMGVLRGKIDPLKYPRKFPRTCAQNDAQLYPLTKLQRKLYAVDELIEGFGVEAISTLGEFDSYWGDTVSEYINVGDTYVTTVLYDYSEKEWCLTSWGDWYEQRLSQVEADQLAFS